MKFSIYTLGVLLLLSCNLQNKKLTNSNPGRPNIVWIIAEDLSPDLACYGNDLVKTPAIDDLSNKGVKYPNVFATGPACAPSRTALVTGYYQNAIGAHHMRFPDHLKPALPEGVHPIHRLLKNNGYQTANIKSYPGNGKTDWLFRYDTDTYDHDRWEHINKSTPFFARICLSLTHRPFVRDTIRPVDPAMVRVPPYYPDHPVARKDWARYFESIQVLDRQVAHIIQDLKKSNLLDNTLIFFFSDHGRPMTRGKNYLYDSGLKVPLIVTSYDTGLREKYLNYTASDNRLLSLIDVNSTTLALTGEQNYTSHGVPFLPEPVTEARKYIFGTTDRIGETFFKSRSVRTLKLKYIRNYHHDLSVNGAATAYRKANHPIYHLLNVLAEDNQLNPHQRKLLQTMEPEELYDIKNDPYELNNLAARPEWADTLVSLGNSLDHWIKEITDKGMEEDTPEVVAAFEKYDTKSQQKHSQAIKRLEKKVRNEMGAN